MAYFQSAVAAILLFHRMTLAELRPAFLLIVNSSALSTVNFMLSYF